MKDTQGLDACRVVDECCDDRRLLFISCVYFCLCSIFHHTASLIRNDSSQSTSLVVIVGSRFH